jgi:hypothetical protein
MVCFIDMKPNFQINFSDYIYIMSDSPRSHKGRFTRKISKLDSALAAVAEETSPMGRGKIQLPRLSLLTVHHDEEGSGNSNVRRHGELEPMISMAKTSPKKSNELRFLKMSLDKCDPQNIYELVKEYVNKSATMEDVEYATSKFAHIKPSIAQRQIARMEQLIRSKVASLTKDAVSPGKGGSKSRKSRKSLRLNRKRTSSYSRK